MSNMQQKTTFVIWLIDCIWHGFVLTKPHSSSLCLFFLDCELVTDLSWQHCEHDRPLCGKHKLVPFAFTGEQRWNVVVGVVVVVVLVILGVVVGYFCLKQ